jgi:hypothetical protein
MPPAATLFVLLGSLVLGCTHVLGIAHDYRLQLGGAGGAAGGSGAGGGGGVMDTCPDPIDPPGGMCPSECTGGCQGTTCMIDCGNNGCPDAMSTCPTGFDCEARCSGGGDCNDMTLTCPPQASCLLRCDSINGCMNVTLVCGDGPCALDCNGNANTCNNAQLVCGSGRCSCDGESSVDVQCGPSCGCYEC